MSCNVQLKFVEQHRITCVRASLNDIRHPKSEANVGLEVGRNVGLGIGRDDGLGIGRDDGLDVVVGLWIGRDDGDCESVTFPVDPVAGNISRCEIADPALFFWFQKWKNLKGFPASTQHNTKGEGGQIHVE